MASKSKLLKRFYDLIKEIADFMKEKTMPGIYDLTCRYGLAFLVGITGHYDLNLTLQEQGPLVNQLFSHLKAFQNKVRLWETQMRSKTCSHFLTLSSHENIEYGQYAAKLKQSSEQVFVSVMLKTHIKSVCKKSIYN